jgi:hypothetical protein
MRSDVDVGMGKTSISNGELEEQIVTALAEATGRDTMEIPPVHESADLDALRALVVDRTDDIFVQFDHVGCTVTIGDEHVTATAN